MLRNRTEVEDQKRAETFRIVTIYALFGLAWIYGSDTVLAWLFTDRGLLVRMAVVKGSLFILSTALLLYFLIDRFANRLRLAERQQIDTLRSYQTIFNSTGEAMLVLEANGRIVEANGRMRDIFGYGHDEALALEADQLLQSEAPFTGAKFLENMQKAMREGERSFQWRSRKRCGEAFWAEVSLKRMKTAGEDGILAVIRDVTDRKRQEDSLREMNEQLNFFFVYAPASLAMFDREMRYIQVSRRWQSDYGMKDRDLVGKSHYEVFPEIPEQWKEAHRRGLAGEILREEADEFRRADGSLQWLRWEIRPWYESQGTVGGIVIFTEDITQRRLIEIALCANERFLRMLTDQLPGMVGYWTADLRCSFANKAYHQWFGRSPEQMTWGSLQELMGEELFREHDKRMRMALQGEPQHFESELVDPDGQTQYTWTHYIPDQVNGSARGVFVLVTDVTELKLAEAEKVRLEKSLQQSQKMESVGRLAGGVAHDFNNLLTVILGLTELGMLELEPGHPTRSRLEGVREAAERSANLTRQLLGFARQQTVAPRVLDLNQAVQEMLQMLTRMVGEDVDLIWRPADHLWPVKIDLSQLDQLLANLCVNARDAIDDVGTITIETQNRVFDGAYCAENYGFIPGEYVVLSVSDDGHGMDKETVAHIFEPFFTTKEIGKGTGLGLSTVYGIVKQNDGFINTYSEPGRGTTFKIYLPRHQGVAVQQKAEPAQEPVSHGRETILLVEDEPAIRDLTATLLELLGYRVLTGSTPAEALEIARERSVEIDLLITDVVMPKMNGRDLSRHLLPLCPGAKCLYMSGYTANAMALNDVIEEDLHFISKPFSMAELSAKVREVLDA